MITSNNIAQVKTNQFCSSETTFTDRNGILTNPSYENYDTNLNCIARIVPTVNTKVVKAYIIDMAISDK